MADGRHLKKSKNVVLIDIITSRIKTGNKTAKCKKNCSIYTLLTAMDRKPQKSLKGNVNHTDIYIQAMLVWLTLPFNDFFAVFDPSPLTVYINCSFLKTFIMAKSVCMVAS